MQYTKRMLTETKISWRVKTEKTLFFGKYFRFFPNIFYNLFSSNQYNKHVLHVYIAISYMWY